MKEERWQSRRESFLWILLFLLVVCVSGVKGEAAGALTIQSCRIDPSNHGRVEVTATGSPYVSGTDGNYYLVALLPYEKAVSQKSILAGTLPQQSLVKYGADLNLNSTYENVLGQISVSAASDTRVIAISVTDKDPYEARDIANAVRNAAAAHIQSVMNTEAVTVVDEANIPTKKSSPSTIKNVAIAGGVSLFLALAVCVVLYLMNDKVTTAEDVERYLGLSVLASMPLEEEEVRRKKARKKLEKKKRRATARR